LSPHGGLRTNEDANLKGPLLEDLDERDQVCATHTAEALQYRLLDRSPG
jgi:hypothetical protein